MPKNDWRAIKKARRRAHRIPLKEALACLLAGAVVGGGIVLIFWWRVL